MSGPKSKRESPSASGSAKVDLVRAAEALLESDDWRARAKGMRRLHRRLQEILTPGNPEDDALMARFRAAHQAHLDRRSAQFDQGHRRKLANLRDELHDKQQQAALLQQTMLFARAKVKDYQGELAQTPAGPHQEPVKAFISETIETVDKEADDKEEALKQLEKEIAELSQNAHGV